jgi:High potential iron-sulfur protein
LLLFDAAQTGVRFGNSAEDMAAAHYRLCGIEHSEWPRGHGDSSRMNTRDGASVPQPKECTMTQSASSATRRRFIKLTVTGLAAFPVCGALVGNAAAADVVTESNPQASALGYKTDATKAANRKDPKADCGNCNFYTGKAGAANGPCAIFAGNLVTANGWCTAWAKKA